MAEEEKVSVTGLDMASNRKDAEYDLTKALLTAMDYQKADDLVTEVEIRRNGNYLFTVHIHPLSDEQLRFARKKAAVMIPNPNGKKLPKIEKETNSVALKSWVIYLATTEEDQEKIWGNPVVKQKAPAIMENWEAIDVLLTAGEKLALFNKVTDISGLNDDLEDEDMDTEEYAKN